MRIYIYAYIYMRIYMRMYMRIYAYITGRPDRAGHTWPGTFSFDLGLDRLPKPVLHHNSPQLPPPLLQASIQRLSVTSAEWVPHRLEFASTTVILIPNAWSTQGGAGHARLHFWESGNAHDDPDANSKMVTWSCKYIVGRMGTIFSFHGRIHVKVRTRIL